MVFVCTFLKLELFFSKWAAYRARNSKDLAFAVRSEIFNIKPDCHEPFNCIGFTIENAGKNAKHAKMI